MSKIKSGGIVMKPKWYFVLGSILSILGFVGLSIGALFTLNVSLFLLREHGQMGEWRLQLMLQSFPWWVPVLAVVQLVIGLLLLKKFDFSYKKNFGILAIGIVGSIAIAALLIDATGINSSWFGQGRLQKNRGINKQESGEVLPQFEKNNAFMQTDEKQLNSTLSDQTIEYLNLALADERKALATYQAVMQEFGEVRPFVNIAQAEQQHISQLLKLYAAYGVPVPEDTTVVGPLPSSLQEVCAIGVQAEIENDALYQRMIPSIQEDGIQAVFVSLARASKEMHLPAFERCAE